MSEVNELKDVHDKLHGMIDEIDVKLDSLMDPTSAGKTKIINERVSANQEHADKVVNNIVGQLENASIDQKIGIYYALVRGLNQAYKEPVEAAIAELIKTQPKVEPLVSEEEAKELSKVRSDLAAKVKQLKGMAGIFGNDADFREAKKRTGKSGKRGPRALSFYTFYVGEKEFKNLKEVQEAYAQYFDKVADITAAMRGDKQKTDKETGELVFDPKGNPVMVRGVAGEGNPNFIDTSDPEETFYFTLPDGDILQGVKNAVDPDEEEDDDTEPEAEESE